MIFNTEARGHGVDFSAKQGLISVSQKQEIVEIESVKVIRVESLRSVSCELWDATLIAALI